MKTTYILMGISAGALAFSTACQDGKDEKEPEDFGCASTEYFHRQQGCLPVSECAENEYIQTDATATSDRVCATAKSCSGPYQTEAIPPSAHNDRVCCNYIGTSVYVDEEIDWPNPQGTSAGCLVIEGDLNVGEGAPPSALPVVAVKGTVDLSDLHDNVPPPLQALRFVQEDVVIRGNSTRQNLDFLASLEYVGGRLIIEENDALVSIDGLNSLRQVKVLSLKDLPVLDGLPAFPYLTRIEESMTWYHLESLVHMRGFEALESVGDGLNLSTNLAMEQLTGLQNLRRVEGQVLLSTHPKLHDMSGLSALEEVGGDMMLMRHDVLDDLQGLEGLKRVGGAFGISENASLRSLHGLEHLERAEVWFALSHNPELESILELSSLSYVGDYLGVQHNPRLCNAQAEALAEQLADGLVGELSVINNQTADGLACP